MPTYADMLKDAYLEKSECVIDFPRWLLSPAQIRNYKGIPGLAIVEMAGRDSVAAAIRAAEERGYTDFIPTYTIPGRSSEAGGAFRMRLIVSRNDFPEYGFMN